MTPSSQVAQPLDGILRKFNIVRFIQFLRTQLS